MDSSVFFESVVSTRGSGSKPALRRDFLQGVELSASSRYPDLEIAPLLADLAAQEFGAFISDEATLSNSDIGAVVRALRSCVDRLGMPFTLYWRDFHSFKGHWGHAGAVNRGAWAKRRQLITDSFDPLKDALAAAAADGAAAHGVAPASVAGWDAIDAEIAGVRSRFDTAKSAQDYRDVGNRCVGALEAMSRNLYDPERHRRSGETEPPASSTKIRLERFVEDSLVGADNKMLRALARNVIEVAQGVKHSPTPTRREAGIAADAVILLASILRRAEESD